MRCTVCSRGVYRNQPTAFLMYWQVHTISTSVGAYPTDDTTGCPFPSGMHPWVVLGCVFALVGSVHGTAAPTAGPTAQPTAQPTARPTALPTAQPTAQPTAEPSAAPTANPTATLSRTLVMSRLGRSLPSAFFNPLIIASGLDLYTIPMTEPITLCPDDPNQIVLERFQLRRADSVDVGRPSERRVSDGVPFEDVVPIKFSLNASQAQSRAHKGRDLFLCDATLGWVPSWKYSCDSLPTTARPPRLNNSLELLTADVCQAAYAVIAEPVIKADSECDNVNRLCVKCYHPWRDCACGTNSSSTLVSDKKALAFGSIYPVAFFFLSMGVFLVNRSRRFESALTEDEGEQLVDPTASSSAVDFIRRANGATWVYFVFGSVFSVTFFMARTFAVSDGLANYPTSTSNSNVSRDGTVTAAWFASFIGAWFMFTGGYPVSELVGRDKCGLPSMVLATERMVFMAAFFLLVAFVNSQPLMSIVSAANGIDHVSHYVGTMATVTLPLGYGLAFLCGWLRPYVRGKWKYAFNLIGLVPLAVACGFWVAIMARIPCEDV